MKEAGGIIVQMVEVHWSKAQRGGEGATERNAVASGFLLPANAFEGHPMLHRVVYDLRHRAEAYESCDPIPPKSANRLTVPSVTLTRQEDGTWQAALIWNIVNIGLPERRNHPLFNLAPGEWGRFEINGRVGSTVTSGAEWSYRKITYNIGLGLSDPKTFLATQPTKQTAEMANLF